MKLSFSTLGCPDWSFEKVLEQAQAMGYDGIEVRGINGIMNAAEIPEFSTENIADTQKKLEEHSLKICCFGTSVSLHDPEKHDEMMRTGKAEIDALSRAGIPYMRVFGNNIPDPAKQDETVGCVADGLRELCGYAADKNVTVLLEVHGDFNTVEAVRGVCLRLDDMPSFGILWDIAHSDKVYGDDFGTFYDAVRPWIKHIHIKDHVRLENGTKLVRLGEGDIPIEKIVKRLQKDGFNGWYSLEWEKKWHPELPEAEIAFADFIRVMRAAQLKKIRAAVIGYGRSGRDIHTHLMNMLPDAYEIVMYADELPERREKISRETGKPVYDSYKAFFEHKDEIDIVVNASYSRDHAPISIDLMEHGFDVLSEKPAASGIAEFEKALEAQKRTGRRYFIFQQYRFSPVHNKIKEIVASGVLGELLQINYRYNGFSRRWDWQTVHDRFSAGVLRNTGPHPMDMALDMIGFPEDFNVFCRMGKASYAGNAEDYVKLIIDAKDKPLVDIEISECDAYTKYTYKLEGKRGTLIGTGKGLKWTWYRDDENTPLALDEKPLSNEKGDPCYCRENLIKHEAEWLPNVYERKEGDAKGKAYYTALYETLTEGRDFPEQLSEIACQMKLVTKAFMQNKELFGDYFQFGD